ncbi:hypothetical protein M9H77_28474 [Catharanthus roseus]|uniref:Uncharacterized protein n=1 Tax=Catharanthus roseus TaxID=4058 RepID=A0ACC0AG23_CATRO|nr:hypothetical protein M9H77_28474 [Catharanthus roseus]
MKKNRKQGRNAIEEILCLSAQRGYTVFYRNCEYNKILSDIVVAHPTSIEIIRTWTYVLIMDITYKTNMYVILHDLASLLDQISTGTISKVKEILIGKSSGSGSGSGSGYGSGSCGRGRPPRAPRGRGMGRGCSSGRSSLSSVIDLSTPSTFSFFDAFIGFVYPFIENWKNVIGDGNCGYQVVADFVFIDENQWPRSIDECLLNWSI